MNSAELSSLSIRAMSAGDASAVSRLILKLFDEFVAPGYSKEAGKTFRRQTRRQSRCKELRPGEMRMVAMSGGELVGVIGVRDVSHVHWLWVRKDWHRRGVARSLMAHVIAAVCEQRPDVVSITLNSSPFAIPCYLRLGFQISGDNVDQKGIICTPMRLQLEQQQNTADVAGIGVEGEA